MTTNPRFINTRLGLLLLLKKAPRKPLEHYARKLGVTVSALSHHAAELEGAGIIDHMREDTDTAGRPRKLWYLKVEALEMSAGLGLTIGDMARLARRVR